MLNPVRALALAGLLCLGAGRTGAAAVQPDTSGLQFLGFRAGARLEELDTQLRHLGGQALRCRRSKIDRHVSECRAALSEPELGGVVDLWVSAIDSVAGVITLSGTVAPGQLDRWRQVLQERYGRVGPRIQGTQSMLQWVRRGRMLRLTWRMERSGKVASVSLVDGRVLDEWGRSRRSTPAMRPSGERRGA
ncbi:MAG: hypothetical protein ACJ8BF_00225 [Gemmatimonadales bacterium]